MVNGLVVIIDFTVKNRIIFKKENKMPSTNVLRFQRRAGFVQNRMLKTYSSSGNVGFLIILPIVFGVLKPFFQRKRSEEIAVKNGAFAARFCNRGNLLESKKEV